MRALHELTADLGEVKALDKASAVIDGIGAPLQKARGVKSLLNGVWLEHPLHPLLVALPIGAWAGGSLVDILGGRRRQAAADAMVAVGTVAAVPTAAAGLAQWVDLDGAPRRIGAAHATLNVVALVLQILSLLARRRRRRMAGVALSAAAMGAVSASGYLGGHMTYSIGVGVDHTAFEPPLRDWTATDVRDSDLGEQQLRLATVGDRRVLLTRLRGELKAYAESCTHMGGPLSEGAIVDCDGEPCVECPWHLSRFRLADGSVADSPATVPAHVYATRVVDGMVEVVDATSI